LQKVGRDVEKEKKKADEALAAALVVVAASALAQIMLEPRIEAIPKSSNKRKRGPTATATATAAGRLSARKRRAPTVYEG